MSQSDDSSEAGGVAAVDWEEIASRSTFEELIKAKSRFIIPMSIFFLAFYFALPLLAGLAPELMAKKVWGTVNVIYLFALSQFFMTWTVAIIYARAASKFDDRAHEIISDLES